MTKSLGSCDCGGVMFEISGRPGPVIGCHCDQCRKSSGHFWAAAPVLHQNLRITSDVTLKWFRSSDLVEKGFCTVCGSSLFWKLDGAQTISVGAGTLENPSHRKMTKHIFVSEKGDYYDVDDGLPQAAQFDLDAGDPAE